MDGYEWVYTDCDQVQLARLIGQLHYSAMTAGCEDSAAELRDMHVRMLMSGDELQQVNGIRSLPDFARHDSAAVAAHIERCCGELVRLLHPSTGAGGRRTRPACTCWTRLCLSCPRLCGAWMRTSCRMRSASAAARSRLAAAAARSRRVAQ